MIDSDLFTLVDGVARKVRQKNLPMGGVQVVVCGDFLQLPPVVNDIGDERIFPLPLSHMRFRVQRRRIGASASIARPGKSANLRCKRLSFDMPV